MHPILIVREELLCLVILLFTMYNSRLYSMGKDQGNFLRICLFAIGHVIFDLITVLTVNRPDTVPPGLNWACHIIFYLFALLYSYEFFCYIIALCRSKMALRRCRRLGVVPIALYLVALPFLPMYYLEGKGTYYSFGPAAIAGYGVAMLFFLASIGVVLHYRRALDRHIVYTLLPMLAASITMEILQIAVPEALFTGGAVTIITVGFFFSLENPVTVLRQKVLIDALTGVKSRHSYEADITRLDRAFAAGTQFGMVFCDINDLKAVNDTYGHLEGDVYIGQVAQILTEHLRGADALYRMGGDEFLAVYQGKDSSVIQREMEAVSTACEEQSRQCSYEISVAMGCAVSNSAYKSLRDVLRMADYQMYSDKSRLKRQRTYLLTGGEALNVDGLTDRIFDAFADADVNRFLFVTNLSTNVTRWSHSAAEYFGLPGEFVFDCNDLMQERVHPEDYDMFSRDIRSVFSGAQHQHDIQCRIRNASEQYVLFNCTGTFLRGKGGSPDLFAGTLTMRDSDESMDHMTGLRNEYEMLNYFNYLLRSHTPAALLELSIVNLSRINILYGYISGNDILRQLAMVIRSVVDSDGGIFRTSGTKFVICLPGTSQEAATEIYLKIRRAAERRIRIETLKPPLQLAGGGYILTEGFNGSISTLRSNLINAHAQSKYEQRGRLVFFNGTSVLENDSSYKNKLMLSIHQDAITACSGFFLVYQPVVCAATGEIVGAEALLRWSNDAFGLVRPDSFIPWLEGDPCFFHLGNWILRSALLDAQRFLALRPDFVINVNIAMPQLEHERFRSAVLDILAETGFPPDHLCLELTERCRELEPGFLKGEIEFFRSHGIRVALDDLGTGFSSFGLLLSLNVDEIKLDHSFIGEVQDKRANQVLTRMLVDASNSMGYATCLEGVEDETLCAYLSSFGATYYQGYYCAEPLEAEAFIRHMTHWNATRIPKQTESTAKSKA